MSVKKIPASVPEIDEPNDDPNGTVPVGVLTNGPPYGVLCKCSGSVLPTAGMRFKGVLLKVGKGETVYTKQQVIQSPDARIPASEIFPPDGIPTGDSGPWSRNSTLNSACSASGAKNTLHAVCFQETNEDIPQDTSLMTKAVFFGKGVAACT